MGKESMFWRTITEKFLSWLCLKIGIADFCIRDWVPVDEEDIITELHLKNCVKAHSCIAPEKYDLALIEEKVESIYLERADYAFTIEQKVWKMVHLYLHELESCEYSKFYWSRSKLAVDHVMKQASKRSISSKQNVDHCLLESGSRIQERR